jgi:hypothetical protein
MRFDLGDTSMLKLSSEGEEDRTDQGQRNPDGLPGINGDLTRQIG